MTDEIASSRASLLKGGDRTSLKPAGASRPPALALVGFMGAGKTTVGRALAARLDWHFEDLDDLIQTREGCSIEGIFRERGELVFRDLERRTLSEILTAAKQRPSVLALGGGAFFSEPIREMLRQAEIPAVFLDASVEELFRRSEEPGVVRPMRREREQFSQLYRERLPSYREAQLRIETEGRAIAAIVDEIVAALLVAYTYLGPGSESKGEER